ncbi:holo-[acyl-carrier-protein] synthase [Aphanomyces invadans]|uniref:Holo-[acyl-carrier-protein] synthase n=1 Tax=Aphanomyces invadans TaxID=157072 RepID=A0A024TSY3_9STRA|nr:holo-[acyl-carrier-protein] synthase [Aphanomyces invadans]ETV97148.1 holo-[acyl-carrier-protein] synthase [Aphanomyces invadans]|eukprot:XP_008874394.1 holo-[acyl-carrier-protein] synthase [Aphanomyces invadans]
MSASVPSTPAAGVPEVATVPAIVADTATGFAVTFGGQANEYIAELTTLVEKFPTVRAFVEAAQSALVEEAKAFSDITIQPFLWTQDTSTRPSKDALSAASLSYPLIFLTQFANYLAFLESAHLTHEAFVPKLRAGSGHSQGVVAAVLLSAAKTSEDLHSLGLKFVRYMFLHGVRAQAIFGTVSKSGDISPMLLVRGLPEAALRKAVDGVNSKLKLKDARALQLSLFNDTTAIVVTGLPDVLVLLKTTLEKISAKPDESQGRIPFSQRKPVISFVPLAVSVAFHNTTLVPAQSAIEADLTRLDLTIPGSALQFAVIGTNQHAVNLQTYGAKNVMPDVVQMQLSDIVNWPATTAAIQKVGRVTHVLDFGPARGAATLTLKQVEGYGITTVVPTILHKASETLPGLDYILTTSSNFVAQSWEALYGPTLTKTVDGATVLHNKYTARFGRQPVWVGGMTPTTSYYGVPLVAAITESGYIGELACGGLPRPAIFESKVADLLSRLSPGNGIYLNLLYLNAKQWAFQFPMIKKMRQDGIPIEGVTVAAGIPTPDKADQVFKELLSVNINVISFKPSSISSIHDVLNIAKKHPTATVVIQWTGGRAGGHHSSEDFHTPLLATYAAVRRSPNVILIVGSGFGSAEQSYPYITGEWSLAFGEPKMPVDGILVASRVMVAKEAATADAVKSLLVETPGIPDESTWELSYESSAGGVITLKSELGEAIHKIENRGSLCWRDFDRKYFALPMKDQEAAILSDKDAIIARVNADFQKPYFGRTVSGKVVDVEQMTYLDVISRLVSLMYVTSSKRWIDATFMSRVFAFLQRTEQRFLTKATTTSKLVVQKASQLKTDPWALVQTFTAAYPSIATALLNVEDVDFFYHSCKFGGKPVNFIPIIDKELITWFKKDSLWYSEDLEAVPDQDAGRVMILQGPLAVYHIKTKNEPVGDILKGISDGVVKTMVAKTFPQHSRSVSAVAIDGWTRAVATNNRIVLSKSIVDAGADGWMAELASVVTPNNWLHDLLTMDHHVSGRQWVANGTPQVLSPRTGQTFQVEFNGTTPIALRVIHAAVVPTAPVVEITKSVDNVITMRLNIVRPATREWPSEVVALDRVFHYKPALSWSPIHIDDAVSEHNVKAFYAQHWIATTVASSQPALESSVQATHTATFVVTAEDIDEYNKSLGLVGRTTAPVDFSTVAGWKPLITPVFAKEISGDLLRLVHLSHSYTLLDPTDDGSFAAGDKVVSTGFVTAMRNTASGKLVQGVIVVAKNGVDVVRVQSEFLIRGTFTDHHHTFEKKETTHVVHLADKAAVTILGDKSWFKSTSGALLRAGASYKFVLKSSYVYADGHSSLSSFDVQGSVYGGANFDQVVGAVSIKESGVAKDPVASYLERVAPATDAGKAATPCNLLETPITISIPDFAGDYARASRDLNPIHRCAYSAAFANLPNGQPIMHGMWTATKVRNLVMDVMADQFQVSHLQSYHADFKGMVYNSESLYLQVTQSGVSDGLILLSVNVANSRGESVFGAKAKVVMPKTAFVFTGQGSAQVGMGMDLYASSPVVRKIWDDGDQHLLEKFGFSILDIVRKNPDSLTIYFGGKRGMAIRENYMALRCQKPDAAAPNGTKTVPLFPEITPTTQSFTFSAPTGLLFATQFSQPALVLMEKALFNEAKSRGVVPSDCYFAGHSLGEYAALSSFAEILATPDLAEVVFLRGMVMQNAVERDVNGLSDYGMVAANPARVGSKLFDELTLFKLLDLIEEQSGQLCQVVNFNVQDSQYVVAGELVNLEVLSRIMTTLREQPTSLETVGLESLVQESLVLVRSQKEALVSKGKTFGLKRGTSTIPLVGIDVPFHSRKLLSGVPAFRELMRPMLKKDVLFGNKALLESHYIPNLIAKPFSCTKEYVQEIVDLTGSPSLTPILANWDTTPPDELVWTLVIELLAYQFASPVQWIKTQAYLFNSGLRRFVEIGPSATLTGMATRTLQSGRFPRTKCDILFITKDRDTIYYDNESDHPSAVDYAHAQAAAVSHPEASENQAEEEAAPAAPVVAAPAPVVAAPVVVAAPAPVASAPAAAVTDEPVSANHVLRVFLAHRFKKQLAEIDDNATIQGLAAGKSAAQNEVVGELEKEFGGGVDRVPELPLSVLASSFKSYKGFGPVFGTLTTDFVRKQLPGGFNINQVKTYLSTEFGLGAGRVDSVLMHALLFPPASRHANEGVAKSWLDTVVADYAKFAGVSISKGGAAQGGGGGAMMMMPSFSAAAAVEPVPDADITAAYGLKAFLAHKFKKKFADVTDAVSVHDLAAGKSAVQNEVVGELEAEFGGGVDGVAETKIGDLAPKFAGYTKPGKYFTSTVAKMLSAKLPGGFSASQLRAYMAQERVLGPKRIEIALIHSLINMPEARFATEADAKTWINSVVDEYGSIAGVTIPYASKAGPAVGGGMAMMGGGGGGVSSAALDGLRNEMITMLRDQVTAYQAFMKFDPLDALKKTNSDEALRRDLEKQVDLWVTEHGEYYEKGIQAKFDANKIRIYDSSWNWVMQDALDFYYKTLANTIPSKKSHGAGFDRDAHLAEMSAFLNADASQLTKMGEPQGWFKPFLCNRATPELLAATEFFLSRQQANGNLEYAQAIQLLNEEVEKWMDRDPVHMQLLQPFRPEVTVEANGNIVYKEVPRGATSVDYVDELSRGFAYRTDDHKIASPKSAHSSVALVRGMETAELDDGHESDVNSVSSEPAFNKRIAAKRSTRVHGSKLWGLKAVTRRLKRAKAANATQHVLPYVHIRKADHVDPTNRVVDEHLTKDFLLSMHEIATSGVSFVGKNALVTGCGRDSIASEVVKALLEGGATVICTTSSFSSKSTKFFRNVYENHGSRGSKLILLPFNQASSKDCGSLVAHIYEQLKLDLDFVIPFGAISVVGPTLADIDSKSELAHRIMLTNTYRILGKIIDYKRAQNIRTRPCLAMLPLSPNHGTMGGDGLYAEAKLGLEALMNKWHSEGWEDYISVGGAVIGWTRGTGLMAGNNFVSAGIEQLGVRTFSQIEMAFNLTSILHPRMVAAAAKAPLWVDLGGGMAQLHDLKVQTDKIRASIMEESKIRRASVDDHKKDSAVATDDDDKPVLNRANMHKYYSQFPDLPPASELRKLGKDYQGMINLEKTIVVVGFGEVGPWGNSRTRWEMESYGVFSLEGCIELAWMLGYITYHNGPAKSGEHYIGWVDAKTKDPVADTQVKSLYEESILKHSGIRVVEPELFDGYDPKKKMFLQQVAVDKNMRPIEVASREEGLEYQKELGEENCDVFELDGTWMLRLRQGAVLSIPKSLHFNRWVAGQIPTGWDAKRYGVPADIAEAVDPITLFTLVSTAEALISAGITDPYEFYQYVHVSQVGNTSGSGMGGMRSLRRIYHDRAIGKNIPSDSLQECFINTMSAWVNMLLLSSSGPIKTPVGACATAAESVDIGVETILSGKARVVLVGGYDDFCEVGSYEFAQMKATSDSEKETAMGRDPREMCRPCTDTRGGFMEAQGAGIQVLMDAALALDMGVPIYGVVGITNTATDKNGRSVPAPGKGVSTTAREHVVGNDNMRNALLNPAFRRAQFEEELEAIEQWKARQLKNIAAGVQSLYDADMVHELAEKKVKQAQFTWGHEYFKGNAGISPLRGALNMWGLTTDDIGVASFHGTGTNANDKNESEITHRQLEHLGRTSGNPIMVVCQKYLTGHPKGAAAAWMFNGLLQIIQSGIVPGNANNDNTAPELQKFDMLVYPNRSIQTDGIKAALMKSFGFGQAGAEVLLIHPNYLLAALSDAQFAKYVTQRSQRAGGLHQYMQDVLSGKNTLVRVKEHAPYTTENEMNVYLNPLARASYNTKEKTWTFGDVSSAKAVKQATDVMAAVAPTPSVDELPKKMLESSLAQSGAQLILSSGQGLGIDVEPVATFADYANKQVFIQRNFTPVEIAYCEASASAASSFAGRWAAKEAVIKAICNANPSAKITEGADAPLIDIEVGKATSGAPTVTLTGRALEAFQTSNLSSIKLSITHSGDYAVAQALVL